MENDSRLSERFRSIRGRLDMSQEELGDEVGLSKGRISQIENETDGTVKTGRAVLKQLERLEAIEGAKA